MPSLSDELRRLQLADDHIDRGERAIARLERAIRQDRAGPESAATLATIKAGLLELREHRRLVAAVIDDIRAGRLKDTGPRVFPGHAAPSQSASLPAAAANGPVISGSELQRVALSALDKLSKLDVELAAAYEPFVERRRTRR